MTQDEREQKALEAARVTIDHDKIRDRKAMALAFRWAGKEGIDHHYVWAEKFAHAYHAAMTEGGVWVSREDAEAFASVKWKSTDKDNMEFSATTTCYVMDKLRPAISRLRAKLEGQKP